MNKQMVGYQYTQGKVENMILCTKKTPFLLLLLGAFFIHSNVFADNISTTDKYAYAENSGWLNFNSTHEAVSVFDDHLEGYVWAENVGWIRLGTHIGGGSFSYGNSSATNYGVNNDGSGNLSGYGWGENIGWVNFNPSDSQVTINAITGDFDGYAWAENIGWIHFQNSSPAYKTQRSLLTSNSFVFIDQANVTINTIIASNAVTITGINTNTAISVVGGAYEINGSGTWLTIASTVVNNDSVKVRHTSSASYSTAVNTTLTVGGVSDTFTSTTEVAPILSQTVPDAPDGGYIGGTVTLSSVGKILSGVSVVVAGGNRPANMVSVYGQIAYQVTSAPSALVTTRLVFSTALPAQFEMYKMDLAGDYSLMPENTGSDGFWNRVNANTLEVTIKDNGLFDLNNTLGVVDDPIVVATALAGATARPIPTLSAWGLMFLIGLLSLFSIRFLKPE